MVVKTVSRIAHVLVCLFIGYGVLFSKTQLQAFIVLVSIVIVFLGLRLFKGCMLTELEGGITTHLGRVFMLEDPDSVSLHNFEEIAVGFSLILQLARALAISLNLHNVVF